MPASQINLYFAEGVDFELFETRFMSKYLQQPLVTVRGKTSGAFAFANSGTFQWTKAGRGICVLLVREKLNNLKNEALPFIYGEAASLAASVDDAISKQPAWLIDMLGATSQGDALAKRLFSRTNSGRKRAGPVNISVNRHMLSHEFIKIFLGTRKMEEKVDLERLLIYIEGQRCRWKEQAMGMVWPSPHFVE